MLFATAVEDTMSGTINVPPDPPYVVPITEYNLLYRSDVDEYVAPSHNTQPGGADAEPNAVIMPGGKYASPTSCP